MASKYKINVTEYFDETLKGNPERIAVIDGEKQITFKDLKSRVIALADRISAKTNRKRNQIIAVYLPKSIESVIADLAILHSGNAYMNLDVNNPEARIAAIEEQVNPALILSSEKFKNRLDGRVAIMDVDVDEPPGQGKENWVCGLIDTDPCCVINTSGSTGVPKAVILNHRSFIDFIEEVRSCGFVQEHEVIGSLSPIVFDIYSFELCMLMVWGCTIVVIPETFAAFPAKMLGLMEEHQVSFIFWVPTVMVNIANMDLLSNFSLSSLKMAWFAGEVFPTAKFNYWKRKLPSCRFVNFYGPIEITLDCLYHEVVSELPNETPIPIGRPFRNTAVLILNDENEEAKPGEEGELCIRGSSLAMGYYNNPQKTESAFVQNPLNHSYPEIIYRTGDVVCLNDDGYYVFRGRKDTLVKRMGYRIELTEIEHVAVDTVGIAPNCCALYDQASKDIVLVYESEEQRDPKGMIRSMREVLPKYMVPTKYVRMSELPRNPNGKIDRALLKKRFVSE